MSKQRKVYKLRMEPKALSLTNCCGWRARLDSFAIGPWTDAKRSTKKIKMVLRRTSYRANSLRRKANNHASLKLHGFPKLGTGSQSRNVMEE